MSVKLYNFFMKNYLFILVFLSISSVTNAQKHLNVMTFNVRYSTLRYTFTSEGISMRWGRLFRRGIVLNYARIQDIHLRSNIVGGSA